MNPLLNLALFWTVLAIAAVVFGFLCIKYGVYTTNQHGDHATLDV